MSYTWSTCLKKRGPQAFTWKTRFILNGFTTIRAKSIQLSSEPWLAKIRYALQARSDPDFVIVARTDSFKTVSFAEGIRRSNLALEAGAHMICFTRRKHGATQTTPEGNQWPYELDAWFRPLA